MFNALSHDVFSQNTAVVKEKTVIKADRAYLARNLKSGFLDLRDIGVRRFATICHIGRSRINKFIEGKALPTDDEVLRIRRAIHIVDDEYQRKQDVHSKRDFKNDLKKLADDILADFPETLPENPTCELDNSEVQILSEDLDVLTNIIDDVV
jgi:plasmid maintenance system antidote protein VapI